MPDEDFKMLASMMLANTNAILLLVSECVSLREEILPLLPEKEGALSRLSALEQLQAVVMEAQADLQRTLKELGCD